MQGYFYFNKKTCTAYTLHLQALPANEFCIRLTQQLSKRFMTKPVLHVFLQHAHYPFGNNTAVNTLKKKITLPGARASPMKHVPVLLRQVGFHVEEGILPLLDLGADLLNESKLFRTRSGLAPATTQKQDMPVHASTSFLLKGK